MWSENPTDEEVKQKLQEDLQSFVNYFETEPQNTRQEAAANNFYQALKNLANNSNQLSSDEIMRNLRSLYMSYGDELDPTGSNVYGKERDFIARNMDYFMETYSQPKVQSKPSINESNESDQFEKLNDKLSTAVQALESSVEYKVGNLTSGFFHGRESAKVEAFLREIKNITSRISEGNIDFPVVEGKLKQAYKDLINTEEGDKEDFSRAKKIEELFGPIIEWVDNPEQEQQKVFGKGQG